MIGDLLSEIASSILGDLLSPSTDRGRAWLIFTLACLAAGAQIVAPLASLDPLRGPQWAFGWMALGVVLAIIPFVFSLACLVRLESHRVLSAFSAALSGLALLCPLVWLW